MSLRSNDSELGTQLQSALASLRARGVPFVATPAAVWLEHDLFPTVEGRDGSDGAQRINHLEGAGLTTMPVPTLSPSLDQRRIRYFLDGVQRTLPIGWCGMNALALVVVVAGVIERRPQDGVFRAVPGLVTVVSSIIVATTYENADTDTLIAAFERAGLAVVSCPERAFGSVPAGDFLALQAQIRPAVGKIREGCEIEVFKRWDEKTDYRDGMMVMDGSLPTGDIGNAVGLIKRHSRFDLTNAEMTELLRLPIGYRSSAFQRGVTGGLKPTTWYLRPHASDGADPLYGLVRVEAPSQISTPEEFDRLSRLIFAERTPRATADERWPTLLYPIHIAERILKVKLERVVLGVPAALKRYLREAA